MKIVCVRIYLVLIYACVCIYAHIGHIIRIHIYIYIRKYVININLCEVFKFIQDFSIYRESGNYFK